jgi:single-strand DNA-binding protein
MNNLNSVLLEGILVKDPVYHAIPKVFCSFSIASNRYYQEDKRVEKEVSIFDVEAYGKFVAICRKLGKKGRGVRVVGRLYQKKWNDTKGKEQSKVIIMAEHVEFRPMEVTK